MRTSLGTELFHCLSWNLIVGHWRKEIHSWTFQRF
jgi:hypothetical protein